MTGIVQTDETDRILLDLLQDEFPLASDPWSIIAERSGVPSGEVLPRLKRLSDTGIIRGITPTLESVRATRGISTLIAFRVPEEEIDRIAGVVNRYPEVSHNFRREHEYNLWFTLAARSQERIETILSEICSLTGVHPDDLLDLTTEKKYKIDVRFPIVQGQRRIP